ncbi:MULTISPECIES: S8 family serine peptidase [unclassified Crossiella]|uniref:S8 family peptidase n=1 Tax=unclassified Crossiella TaxID=2620835 RepID=UPI0027E41B64|nr:MULTISPECIES: S8 family serine peptidase [unclassified Crossiella]
MRLGGWTRRIGVTAGVLAVLGSVLASPEVSAAEAEPGQPVLPHVVVGKAGPLGAWQAERAVRQAGGTVVAAYPRIGVVVAYSARDDFAATVRKSRGVTEVGATRTTKLPLDYFKPRRDLRYTGPGSPTSAQVPPEGTAWDVPALGLDEAHRETTGSRHVVVGVLDTGVDDTHPDLRHAVDTRKSVSCVSGWADRSPGGWRPTLDGHGTHVAGTIAAARNGSGVVGVAPGVRLAAVKLAERDDTETAESMICGFMWAAEHNFRITNNSYRATPWRYHCPGQVDQSAIRTAVGRAVAHAQSRGVLVVASGGNGALDLHNRTVDTESPADGTPARREISNDCIRLPHELPGVLGAGAVDEKLVKARFSNHGIGPIGLAAPGVRVWSTVPNGEYAAYSGTSMAAPHVSGVAALLASRHPFWRGDRLAAELQDRANPLPCPEFYDPNGDGKPDATCVTGAGRNSFYGTGLTHAGAALTR